MKYLRWIFRIVTWDGLLPAFVASAPIAITFVFPNNRGAVEITAVVLPIASFFFRYRTGIAQISVNHGPGTMRKLQYATFIIAILILPLFECFVILSHVMPAGPMLAKDALGPLAVFFSIYFGAMAFALFPGPDTDLEDPFNAMLGEIRDGWRGPGFE